MDALNTTSEAHRALNWNTSIHHGYIQSTKTRRVKAGRHLKSPRSFSDKSLHLTLVTVINDRLTPLLFNVNRPSHSWDTAISKFDLANPWSRPCVRSKFKATLWAQETIDSLSFRFRLIGPAIPEIQQFQTLTMKIQDQVHDQGQSGWVILKSNVQPLHLFFVSWQLDRFFMRFSLFDSWPWKLKVNAMAKVKPDGHIWGLVFIRCVWFLFRGHRDHFWPRYHKFHIWFKVNVTTKSTKI